MKRLITISALCLCGSIASAWSIFAAGAAINSAATTNDTADEGDIAAAPGFCIRSVSKDGCDGVVEPGNYEFAGCDVPSCRSIRVTDAVYTTFMSSSNLGCGTFCESPCDDFEDGTLTLKFDYDLRADSCCPYRGSWEGEWQFTSISGRSYSGTAHGTIGVGTNRRSDCLVGGDACENCYDVRNENGVLYVGIEGSFRGYADLSPSIYRDEFTFTCDGTWIVEANAARPFGDPFRVRNRFDGAFVDYCP